VADTKRTFVTFAVAVEASGEWACAVMMGAKTWPFSSSETLRETGVFGLKKASQSDLIADFAAAELMVAGAVGLGGGVLAGADDVTLPLPPQAAAAASTAPAAGAKM